jgi:hypothetical protein
MKLSNLKTALKTCITTNISAFVRSSPGVGKSQAIQQLGKEMGRNVIDLRLALLDPVDLWGLPYVEGGLARRALPEFLPNAERDGEKGILFLDELTSAPQAMQAAAYQLVLDRRLGDYKLPPDWAVIAAGNKTTDRAIVHKSSTALNNRFAHFEVDVDHEEWTAWALGADMPIELVAFLRYRPDLLHSFDPNSSEVAFPSPRSWEFVGRLVSSEPDASVEHALYAGTVGQGPAAELVGFLRVFRTLPDPDGILLNPNAAPVPSDPATLYALSGALSKKANAGNFDRLVTYLDRLPPEFAVLAIKDTIATKPELQSTKTFISWASKNQDVIL